MQLPPEIVYKGVKPTPYVEKLIDRGISGLEQVCDYIISTRILLEQAQGRHQTGNAYEMRIDIRISGRPEIVVKRLSKATKKVPDGQAEVDVEVAEKVVPHKRVITFGVVFSYFNVFIHVESDDIFEADFFGLI